MVDDRKEGDVKTVGEGEGFVTVVDDRKEGDVVAVDNNDKGSLSLLV